jgi:hypothetical protein
MVTHCGGLTRSARRQRSPPLQGRARRRDHAARRGTTAPQWGAAVGRASPVLATRSMAQAKRPCARSRHIRDHASHEPGRVAGVHAGRRGRFSRRRTTCCQAAQARILPHSIACRGGVYANAWQADRRVALEREQPVVWRDCPSCDFHPTLASVLGAALDLPQAMDMTCWLPQTEGRWHR